MALQPPISASPPPGGRYRLNLGTTELRDQVKVNKRDVAADAFSRSWASVAL